MLGWEELSRSALARQFRVAASVPEKLLRMGPIQAQVARSVYVGIAARRHGTTYDDVESAYSAREIVRGSSLRGTVHAVVADEHPILDAVTRRAMAAGWRGHLKVEPAAAQSEMEQFAGDVWRTPEELRTHLAAWLAENGGILSDNPTSRSFAHAHSALIRRPVAGVGWDRQTAPEYRVACNVVAMPPLPSFETALEQICLIHVRAHGPSAPADIAWWSGVGVKIVDTALQALARNGILTAEPGPQGQEFYDDPTQPAAGEADPGTILLPEFDSLICGYAPQNRVRFVDKEARDYYWTMSNGLYSCVLLHDGRLRGSWKLIGAGRKRELHLRMFPGHRKVGSRALKPGLANLETVLAASISSVLVTTA